MTSPAYRLLAALLLLGGLFAIPPAARAAESYDSCANTINTLPATISTQGVWCLQQNLSTNITTGNAITIATNNVTIDCNGFKIGGLAAGNASGANGIYANGRQNATVRNCNIRGFSIGIFLSNGAGHLVEDNRLDNNLLYGIAANGDNIRVRRNAIYDTGGNTGATGATGITAYGDIEDNVVSGLFADVSGGTLRGIRARGAGAQVRNNRVTGFDMTATQGGSVATAEGIRLESERQRASGNHVVGGSDSSPIAGSGIVPSTLGNICMANTAGGFATNDINPFCTGVRNLTP